MADHPSHLWKNGQLIPWETATTHILTHGLHYGSGVFEGIRVHETGKGPAIFRIKEHYERFFKSIAVLKMVIPYNLQDLIEATCEVVRTTKIHEGYIKPLAYYGEGITRLDPSHLPVDVVIFCYPYKVDYIQKPIAVKTSEYIRIHPKSTIITAKICGHYINSLLSILELRGTSYQEALLLDYEGNIAECSSENFFIVKNNKLLTPKTGSILLGITRDTIMTLAKNLDIPVSETTITLDDAYHADEAFLTGTAAGILAIGSIDNKKIRTGEVGPVTRLLRDAYIDCVYGKNKDYEDFLTWV